MEPSGISPATIKALSDKTTEKRKNASKEIERYVYKLVEGKSDKLDELLENINRTYIQANDQQMKKSGYIALAAIGLGLLSDHSVAIEYFPKILKPVLEGMKENDTKVKFQACETMYNIAKSFRTIILPEINEIFKTLLRIIADTDENIKSIAMQLDSMLKDIVNEGLVDNKQFDLKSFMPVLVEKMRVKTQPILMMLISWIRILNSLPSLNLLSYLPSFLDELLEMEGEIKEVRSAADSCLMEFCKELRENPKKRTTEMDSELIQILLVKLNTEKKQPSHQADFSLLAQTIPHDV